jgi:hypothetical protein
VNVGRAFAGPPPFGAPPWIQFATSAIIRWYTLPFISNTPRSLLAGGSGSEASYLSSRYDSSETVRAGSPWHWMQYVTREIRTEVDPQESQL